MLNTIVDHVKTHRHELGKVALFVGSGVVIPPVDRRMDDVIRNMAIKWAGSRVAGLPPEIRGDRALELFAQDIPDHGERCRLLAEDLTDTRAAEGHIRLARLIKDGYFPTVFLTCPDRILEQSLAVHHMEPEKDYHLFVAGQDDMDTIEVGLRESTRVCIVKCGGDVESRFLPVSKAELEAVNASLAQVIADTFRIFSIFVAYTERDRYLLGHVSRDGGKVFWINRMIPMRDELLYDEMKVENPASIEYHQYQPEVMALLEARHSSRHLLCREAGTFNDFFGKLHSRLVRGGRSFGDRRKKDLIVLRGGPYRFLDYFDVRDDAFFFGREKDVTNVAEMIKNNRLSVLFGRSGIGKTSLLRAGIMARFFKEAEDAEDVGSTWLPIYARCLDDPEASIKEAVLSELEDLGFDGAKVPGGAELQGFMATAHELVGRKMVILLDQFEEYFAHLGPRVQEDFLDEMTRCVETLDPIHWIISVREDYVGELYELQSKLPAIMHQMYRLRRLTREEADDAINKPAQNYDLQVERSLTNRLLDDLYREGVEPAQLQIVCDRLYQAKPRGARTITLSIYERLGGAQKILSEFLETSLSQLSAGERRVAREILKHMVASSEVRITRPLERIAAETGQDREEVEGVLARLIDFRLIRSVGKERHRQYELVHEYIAEEIEGWLTEEEIDVQDVQDLITRHLNNYEKFGILMHADELRIINESRDHLSIAPEELELILRSVAVERMDEEYWFGRLKELGERRRPLLLSLAEHEDEHVRSLAARVMGVQGDREFVIPLVRLLDDTVEEVRAEARNALQDMEREIITELSRGSRDGRLAAVKAVGKLRLKRGQRQLPDLLQDGDMELRDALTDAMVAMSDIRGAEMLVRRLGGSEGLPWAGAYVLGHLAHNDEVYGSLVNAAGQYPELSKVHYALGIAAMRRREYDRALQEFDKALNLVRTEDGRGYVQECIAEVQKQRERLAETVDEWPMFHRDPPHRGHAPEVTLEPPLRELWTYATKGPIMASPVVVGDTVFVGSRDHRLYALDAARGAQLWTYATGDRVESTPAVVGGRVFFGSHDGKVYCLDASDGRSLWQRDVHAPIRSSCTMAENRVYVGNRNGMVICLDANSGAVLWEGQTRGEVSAVPAVDDGRVVAGSWDGGIYAFDAASGENLWRHQTEGPVASSVAIDSGVVYCGSDDAYLYALDIKDGHVFWHVHLGGSVRSSPAVTAERVVVGCVDGKLYAMTTGDGDPVWTAQTAEEILASPAIIGHVVYVGSKDGALYAFDLETGEHLWHQQTAFGIYSSPAVAGNILYIGLDYYNVTAFIAE